MSKKRILWIDYSKAFLIFCVVLLHINIQEPYNELINIYLIPLFFFLSGIFSNPSKYSSYSIFVVEKGSRVLIPYIAFNIITYLFWLLIGRHFGLDADSGIHPLQPIYGIIYGSSSLMYHYVPLWFLACLFSAESIYYFIFRKIESTTAAAIATIGLGVVGFLLYKYNGTALPWSIDIAITMLVFYSSGAMLRNTVIANKKNNWQQVLMLIVSGLIVYLSFNLNTKVKVDQNQYGNYLYFMMGAFAGISVLIHLFKLMEDWLKESKTLKFIGQNTLIILALHLISGSVIKALSVYVLNQPLSVYDMGWVKLLYAILSIAILYPVILLFNKYLPTLVGKKTLKS